MYTVYYINIIAHVITLQLQLHACICNVADNTNKHKIIYSSHRLMLACTVLLAYISVKFHCSANERPWFWSRYSRSVKVAISAVVVSTITI